MHDDDKLRFLFAKAFQSGVPNEQCPSPEDLHDAFHRLVDQEAVDAVLDHIVGCSVCAEAWRIARNTPPPAPPRR